MYNEFKLDLPTPLDFCLHFLYMDIDLWQKKESRDDLVVSDPMVLVNLSLPIMYSCLMNYSTSRFKRSVIAIAAICFVAQMPV